MYSLTHIDDSFEKLKDLPDKCFDVCITDPPYNEHVHKNLCSGSLVGKKSVPKYELKFDALKSYEWLHQLYRVTKRWVVVFCALEDFGRFELTVGRPVYVRGCVWYKSNCLGGATSLYAKTQRGICVDRLEHLARLDPSTVQLWTGERWSNVVSFSKTNSKNALRLVLRNGQRIVCTEEHVWPSLRGELPASELVVGDKIKSTTLPDSDGENNVITEPDVAWFLGLYLAEGSRSGSTIQLAGHTKETDYRLSKLAPLVNKFGCSVAVHNSKVGNGTTINIHSLVLNSIIDTFLGGRVSKDKHLKPRVWRQKNIFLSALLDGYLHGDGSKVKNKDAWQVVFCDNKLLSNNLRTICARLGYDCKIRRYPSTNQEKKIFPGYRGMIRMYKNHLIRDGGEIVNIFRTHAEQFYDVEIEDEPHLFALASGILTHNSMGQLTKDRPATAYEGIAIMHGTSVKKRWNGNGSYGIWKCNGTRGKKDRHPNEKPIDLCLKLVSLFSDRGETVFDPFCGSGAIGDAVVRLGHRQYIGWDNDAEWLTKAGNRLSEARGISVQEETALGLCRMNS